MENRRSAGFALAVYGVVTFLAFGFNAPGGDYSDQAVVQFISRDHMWAAFGYAYLGIAGALALLICGLRLREESGSARDLVWALTLVGTATSIVGWFITGGVAVSMAEGGSSVRDRIPHAVVYTLTETSNLLAVCSPALAVGIIAVVLAFRSALPGWLRAFSVIAGVCGILAPFFFTYFIFVLWTIVAGIMLGRDSSPRLPTEPRPSLV